MSVQKQVDAFNTSSAKKCEIVGRLNVTPFPLQSIMGLSKIVTSDNAVLKVEV